MQYDGRDPKEFAIGTLYVDCSFNLNVVQHVEPYVCDGVIHDYNIFGTDVYSDATSGCSLNNCGLQAITDYDEEAFAILVYTKSIPNIKRYYFPKSLLSWWVDELKHKTISSFMKDQHSEFCEDIFNYYTIVKLAIKNIKHCIFYSPDLKRFAYSYINTLEILVSTCKEYTYKKICYV